MKAAHGSDDDDELPPPYSSMNCFPYSVKCSAANLLPAQFGLEKSKHNIDDNASPTVEENE